MGYQRSPAFHIHRFDYSETSQIATFFTRDHGKMTAIAKGARRPKNSYDGPIDLIIQSDLTWIPRPAGSLNILTHCDQIDPLRPLRKDPSLMTYGFWMIFIMNRLNAPGKPNRTFYDLAEQFTRLLPRWENPSRLCVRFDLSVLRALGHLPRLDGCVRCETPVVQIDHVLFSNRYGGAICRNCIRSDTERPPDAPSSRTPAHTTRVLAPSPGTLRVLSALLDRDAPLRAHGALQLSSDQHAEARRVLNHCFRHLLGYNPRVLDTL